MLKLLFYISLLSLFVSCIRQNGSDKFHPNILFIAVDDLRPELGVYGNKIVKSPHIDQLASESYTFLNHFVQVPTCGASRAAILTGMRPKNLIQLRNSVFAEEISKKPESEIPESFIHHLKRNGYYTVGIGKISHSADGLIYGYEEQPTELKELPFSWDEFLFDPGKWKTGWNAFFAFQNGENRQSMGNQVPPYESGNVGDDGYPDGLTSKLAIEKLKELSSKSQPFFLGVGFFKPHLPFNAPQRYWDLYDRTSIPISKNPIIPENINNKSLHQSGEFNSYKLTDEVPSLENIVSEEYARKLNHAYYASVSYVDQQIGNVIEELKALNLYDNTIIVIWGDHGWHLGDQSVWGKHTLFENALRSPLIIKIPGKNNNPENIKSIIESVDLYPSLMELCNIKIPHAIDGNSFIGLINGESNDDNEVAYGYFNKGITIRTKQYRLTKYYRPEEPKIELYDHYIDPIESKNIAQSNPEIVERLMPLLEKGNTGLFENNEQN